MADEKGSSIIISDEPAQTSTISDGLINLATGLGTQKDKSMSNEWLHSNRNVNHINLSARFREDWVSQKVCKIVPPRYFVRLTSGQDCTALALSSWI